MTDADVRQNRTTDLSSERLDELDAAIVARMEMFGAAAGFTNDTGTFWEWLALIAQARRTEQAERERDALRKQVKVLKDGVLGILQCGYNQFDQSQTCPLCNGARHDHTDSDCLLAIADRTMIDSAWVESAALAQPTDRAHTNDVAPGITMSRTEEMWGASCDWGHCDGNGAGFRWCADLKDWLPVCYTHLAAPHGDAQPNDAGGA